MRCNFGKLCDVRVLFLQTWCFLNKKAFKAGFFFFSADLIESFKGEGAFSVKKEHFSFGNCSKVRKLLGKGCFSASSRSIDECDLFLECFKKRRQVCHEQRKGVIYKKIMRLEEEG